MRKAFRPSLESLSDRIAPAMLVTPTTIIVALSPDAGVPEEDNSIRTEEIPADQVPPDPSDPDYVEPISEPLTPIGGPVLIGVNPDGSTSPVRLTPSAEYDLPLFLPDSQEQSMPVPDEGLLDDSSLNLSEPVND